MEELSSPFGFGYLESTTGENLLPAYPPGDCQWRGACREALVVRLNTSPAIAIITINMVDILSKRKKS
jgi:hypothetical protein